jgi:hypothetical protein
MARRNLHLWNSASLRARRRSLIPRESSTTCPRINGWNGRQRFVIAAITLSNDRDAIPDSLKRHPSPKRIGATKTLVAGVDLLDTSDGDRTPYLCLTDCGDPTIQRFFLTGYERAHKIPTAFRPVSGCVKCLNVTIDNGARAILFPRCLLNHLPRVGRDNWSRVTFILEKFNRTNHSEGPKGRPNHRAALFILAGPTKV